MSEHLGTFWPLIAVMSYSKSPNWATKMGTSYCMGVKQCLLENYWLRDGGGEMHTLKTSKKKQFLWQRKIKEGSRRARLWWGRSWTASRTRERGQATPGTAHNRRREEKRDRCWRRISHWGLVSNEDKQGKSKCHGIYFTAVVCRSMLCSQGDIIVTFNNGEN